MAGDLQAVPLANQGIITVSHAPHSMKVPHKAGYSTVSRITSDSLSV
jgi:hypothetical protein